jgi:hypothetical protein
MWYYACSWDVRGDLTLNSMAQIHTSVPLPTSRDLTCSSVRLTCQHASHISVVAHISWDVASREVGRCKGKAIPLQAWTGPEGSRKLRLPQFLGNRYMKAAKVVSFKHRPPLPREIPWYSFLLESNCATAYCRLGIPSVWQRFMFSKVIFFNG